MKRVKSTGIKTESTTPEQVTQQSKYLSESFAGTQTVTESTGMGRTYKNNNMESFNIFAERAMTINSLILETESKELKSEYDQLLKDVTSIISDITDNNRKKWLDHGFEPVV